MAGPALAAAPSPTVRLTADEYRDHMLGGWLGQMVGVSWGAPTEFVYCGTLVPEDKAPAWHDGMANEAFGQDDLYVEMTFLRTLERYGLKVSQRQAGIDFANSGYPLWHANLAGRDALRKGIAPPDSGHPKFNAHADDIDYQIEADFSGLIAPGLPNATIELGEKFGGLMNYGDGLYAGQFIGAMYGAAFFEKDPEKLVEAGLEAIPAQSQYAECIRDVLAWYRAEPNDWQKTWKRIDEKYQRNPDYRKASCDKGAFNIDAKINGAYVVMGLLYGKGDPDQTTIISMRCGLDSDCNPSSALGVLGTAIGYKALPEKYRRGLDMQTKFSHTDYNFAGLQRACEKVARQVVRQQGGRIEKDANGQEVFVIPVVKARPSALVQCWAPGPVANSVYTAAEMKKMAYGTPSIEVQKRLPGWKVENCGDQMEVGLLNEFAGKKNVIATHPLDQNTPCTISRKVSVPKGKSTVLNLTVGNFPRGDWSLVVKVDGVKLLEKTIGVEADNATSWQDVTVDLTAYAGRKVKLELLNAPNGWAWEAAYWAKMEIVSR